MTRNLFVVGFSIFLGLSVPQYFNEFTIRAGHGPVYTASRWVWTIAKHTAMHLTFCLLVSSSGFHIEFACEGWPKLKALTRIPWELLG